MAAGITTKFLQTAHLACDDQGRITLPSHIRNAMAALETSSIVVGKDHELFLRGYNEPAFDRIMDRVNESRYSRSDSVSEEEAQDAEEIARFGYAQFAMCQPDKQGRINIPSYIREAVKIFPGTKITILGQGDHIEIWPMDKYLEKKQAFDEKFNNGQVNFRKFHEKLNK